jgi:hypothetical protein
MRKLFVLALAAASFAACQESKSSLTTDSTVTTTKTETVAHENAAVISFDSGMYNFGKISQGEKVNHEFKFTNTGKSPLIISNATATCGCTTPDIPKEPIKPGDTGVIKVVFNSTGKMGMQDKIVTITSNANPATTEVHLIGEVQELAAK